MRLESDPSAFPSALPPSTTDPKVIAEHDWAAFGELEKMTNHWDRPGWTPSTRAYYWMLTFPDAAALADLAQDCQTKLKHLRFDDIAPEGLHLTLGRIGLVDQIPATHPELLAAAVHDSAPSAFALDAIPLTASRGALRFSVAPWDPVVALHETLSHITAKAGSSLRRPTSALRPHIGISYCNRPIAASTVRESLRPLRSLPSAEVPVEHIRIVELRREDRAYRWRTLHSVRLCP
ncbi:2'-5' RNA ligase family protein [Streptomyces monticola]|uniref:2'-5' RNA ligase family protein n=1 Tax=Streptomyces monticola TaxID=2666263 RepID=A0ABW2JMJ3_9ACTN